jgi:uncharacterized protein (DUF779 family)
MSTAAERAAQLDLVARLKSAYPELPDAPTPDMLDHDRITAYLKPVHDVGGEPDAPMKYENKQYELWEHMTYVICEVLGWRGIWLSEERRRIGNVDVGRAEYLGLPYYGRWLIAVARVLVEKHHIGLTELSERMAEVKERYTGGLDGKGDPQCYAGQAGKAKFKVGDPVVVRELPVIFYTRTPEYVRGAKGEIEAVAYESPAAEDETWDRPAKAEWFYVVKFNMAELFYGYTGTADDVISTEIPEHWLQSAK